MDDSPSCRFEKAPLPSRGASRAVPTLFTRRWTTRLHCLNAAAGVPSPDAQALRQFAPGAPKPCSRALRRRFSAAPALFGRQPSRYSLLHRLYSIIAGHRLRFKCAGDSTRRLTNPQRGMGRSADLPINNQTWWHVRQGCIFRERTLAFAEKNEYLPVRTFVCASARMSAFLKIVEKPQFFNELRDHPSGWSL